MIKEFYVPDIAPNRQIYTFVSVGVKGKIQKAIVFQPDQGERFNLAFGDIIDNEFDDEIISNNQDLYKVISTVVFCVGLFFKNFPTAIVEIQAVDEKRLRLYNTIFKRKYSEINKEYDILGYRNKKIETYSPKYSYYKFEVSLKYF